MWSYDPPDHSPLKAIIDLKTFTALRSCNDPTNVALWS